MKRPKAGELRQLLLGVAVFSIFCIAAASIRPFLPQGYRDSLAPSLPFPRGDSYLADYRGGVDFYTLYFNLGNSVAPVKRADVLFLGNSRALFGFRRDALRSFFESMGLRYYVLAFGHGEDSVFARALIEKHDLHPKWVVINADPFFREEIGWFGAKVVRESRFDALKFRLETYATFTVSRSLHRRLPYLSPLQTFQEFIWYRSRSDGTVTLTGFRDIRRPRGAQGMDLNPAMFEEAKRFKAVMDRRGIKMVLTCVPPLSPASARVLGASLGVPVLVPEVPGLRTFDGSHLYRESGERFTSALLAAFRPLVEPEASNR